MDHNILIRPEQTIKPNKKNEQSKPSLKRNTLVIIVIKQRHLLSMKETLKGLIIMMGFVIRCYRSLFVKILGKRNDWYFIMNLLIM